jgi:DNA-binding MarR family transcriptional regulator
VTPRSQRPVRDVDGASVQAQATANLLGAVALVITDRATGRVEDACAQTGAAPAALSALRHILTRPSLDDLGQVLGLTPSGTVRLVDRLAGSGLVTRGPGPDGRTRSLVLTAAGRRAATHVTSARADYLHGLLSGLTEPERTQLHALLAKLVAAVVQEKDGGPWTCRLCDLNACGRPRGECPTANAARAKHHR